MPRLSPIPSLALLVAAAQLFSGIASAHIHLLEPIPRYPGEVSGENKACPCGVGLSNRTCNVEGDRSDPDRSTDRVTTLVAGSSIVVHFDEYVGHSGRFRVAFDPNGADLQDFNANILGDITDPPGKVGNMGDGSNWQMTVTVPETPCTNCTLQLIQMMDGKTQEPVADPVGRSSYYQCADITIVAADGSTGAGAEPSPDVTEPDAPGDDSACSLGRASTHGSALGGVSLLLLACAVRRRRLLRRAR